MTDHPLVPPNIRAYMEKHEIENSLKTAINDVLRTMPQDPFSLMAVSLIDSKEQSPELVELRARPVFLNDLQKESL